MTVGELASDSWTRLLFACMMLALSGCEEAGNGWTATGAAVDSDGSGAAADASGDGAGSTDAGKSCIQYESEIKTTVAAFVGANDDCVDHGDCVFLPTMAIPSPGTECYCTGGWYPALGVTVNAGADIAEWATIEATANASGCAFSVCDSVPGVPQCKEGSCVVEDDACPMTVP